MAQIGAASATCPRRSGGAGRFQKNFANRVAAATVGWPPSAKIRLLFQDEGRFGRISDHRRCWAPLPVRPVSPQQIVRQYVYAFAAVSPSDGRVVSLVLPWANADTMSIFLQHVADQFPDEHCLVVLDGAGWHVSGDLRIPERIRLLYLPPYSPELNPAEMLWEHLRENHFGNRAFDSIDDVATHLCDSLRGLDQQRDAIRSLTRFQWFNALPLMAS